MTSTYRCKTCKSSFPNMSAVKRRNRSKYRVTGRVKAVSILSVIVGLAALSAYFGLFASTAQTLPSNRNQMVMHIHPRLEIILDGTRATVPANIGIASNLWENHVLDQYGMTGMAPLHTHDATGTIHVESNANGNYTLGQLFDVWGVPFSESCILNKCSKSGSVSVLIDGVRNNEFRNHVLRDGELIHIEFESSA